MKRHNITLLVASIAALMASLAGIDAAAQRKATQAKRDAATAVQATAYSGPAVDLKTHAWKCEHYMKQPQHKPYNNYQGFDIWGNYMVCLQNAGIAQVYDISGKKPKALTGEFPLGSAGATNHSNTAAFSSQYYAQGDSLPLLYVSRAHVKPYRGLYKAACVERISIGRQQSEEVQVIAYNDYDKTHLGAIQWYVDTQRGFLYGFGATLGSTAVGTKHHILKFHLPVYRGPQDSLVVLTKDDALEDYYMEDTYNREFRDIIQGGGVYGDYMIMPMGLGRPGHPARIYIWNIVRREMAAVIDPGFDDEPEDIAVKDGYIYIQAQNDIYRLSFPQ